jgi:tetratricopeptide (TPR) repeat protein
MAETQTEDQPPAFGEEAHRVLSRARAAAYRLRHASLGTEHLLLGCIEERRGAAAETLYRAGVTTEVVTGCVKLLGNRTLEVPAAELEMAPGLRTALRLAQEEANRLRDEEVRSEHLLLALVSERTSGGAVVLRATGLDVQALRVAIARARLGEASSRVRPPWIAHGPYGALALLGVVAALGAAAFCVRWLVTVRPVVRSAYLFDLLIPLALLSIGLVGLGANRIEAVRQAAEREALLAGWVARGAAAQIVVALTLAQAGSADASIRLLEAAVDREMPEPDVRAAHAALARWLASTDLSPCGYFARGLLRVHNGQSQAALADLEQAVRVRPDETRWQGRYAMWLARAGRDEEALPRLEAAVNQPDVESLVRLEFASLLLRRGQAREAEAQARQVAQALPGASRPLALLAAAKCATGATREALDTLQAVALPDPDDLAAPAVRAAALLRAGKESEALNVLRDAAASTVARPGFLAALEGWALAVLAREQEAALAFAQARERDPRLAAVLLRMRQGLLDNHLDGPARELTTLIEHLAP